MSGHDWKRRDRRSESNWKALENHVGGVGAITRKKRNKNRKGKKQKKEVNKNLFILKVL